jgi:hypothetical protein
MIPRKPSLWKTFLPSTGMTPQPWQLLGALAEAWRCFFAAFGALALQQRNQSPPNAFQQSVALL